MSSVIFISKNKD